MPVRRGMRMRSTSRVPGSIVISPTSATLTSGSPTVQLTAIVKDQTGTVMAGTQPDAWQSANTGVATVSGTGLVTFVAAGGPMNVTASLTTNGNTVTSNACAITGSSATFAAPDILDINFATAANTGTILTGTVGTLTNPFHGVQEYSLISDPTGAGLVKLLQMDYNPGGIFSNDFYVYIDLPTPITYGQRLCIRAEFYYVNNAHQIDNRKTIGIFSNSTTGGQADVDFEINRRDNSLNGNYNMLYHVRDKPGGVLTSYDGDTNILPTFPPDTWFTEELEILCNSADSLTDGYFKIYHNGSSTPSFTLSGLSPITDTGTGSVRLTSVRFGTQVTNSLGTAYTDTRYFQRCAVSTQRIGP